MQRRWVWLHSLLALCLALSWGCTVVPLPSGGSGLSSGPYLIADAAELHLLQELSKSQESIIRGCPQSAGCQRARYTHAIIGLFENGATAASELKALVTHSPSGPFSAAGTRWLQVLEMGFPTSTREQAMRAYLSEQVLRELASAQTTMVQTVSPQAGLSPSFAAPSPVLQQRVKDQERRIAELTSQLNMLKHIDQGRIKER